MKHFFTLVISACHIVVFGQSIQNGDFEDGPHPSFFGQIQYADFWDRGCYGSSGLYPSLRDCQASPVPSGPSQGQVVVGVPAGCINPRNNGSTNCRFGSISCQGNTGASQGPGTSIWNELSSDLLPDVNYEVRAWVARTAFVAPPVGTNSWPVVRRIELVLRATTDGDICDNEIAVPVPIDIVYNNCNWMFISTTFHLTSAQALAGYDRIEFRELARSNYSVESIYIDDVVLLNNGTTGLQEMLSERIKIYPNPVVSELNIETDLQYERAVILDQTGRELLVYSNEKTISLESLSSGVYFIQLVSDGEVHSQRFVKQ